PTPAPTPAPTDKPADDGTPKTGDDSSVTLWLAILLISGGAITVTVRSARKSK
ncbi:MAG: LPXTG cell wall anchor domain-containing protein, partial [Christensenellales bacterium]